MTVTVGNAKVGVGVMVGVAVSVGVRVMVAVSVKVGGGVIVGVNVLVLVPDGVHNPEVAEDAADVIVASTSVGTPQADASTITINKINGN